MKRDAPKSRHGYRIGKDDGIRERDGISSRRGIVAKKALEYGIRSPLPDPDRRKYCIYTIMRYDNSSAAPIGYIYYYKKA